MDDSEKEILQSKMLVGMMDAERKFNDIKMTSYSWMSQVEKSTDCKKYIDEINNNWEKIKKSLDKYARLPLYSGKNSN